MRQCGNCGADISHRAPQARFCEDAECHRVRMLAHGRVSYHRNREEIRQRQNAAYRTRVAAKPKRVIICAHCGKTIAHKAGRARWCNDSCREKARHAADPAIARNKVAAWRILNPDRSRQITERWRTENRERYLDQTRKAHQKRRAWKLGLPGDVSARSWQRLLVVHRFSCAYCGAARVRLTQDHVIPLSRGGRHGEGNIVPACMPCNNSKSDRLLIEWRTGRRIARKRQPVAIDD